MKIHLYRGQPNLHGGQGIVFERLYFAVKSDEGG